MTVSKSPRLGLTRWSDDADPWLRSDWDQDNAQLEALAAMAEAGTLAARPAAAKPGRFYYDSADDSLYYDTGTKWIVVTRFNSDGTFAPAANINASGDGFSITRRNGLANLILSFTSTAGLATNTAIGTAPAGYRPTRNIPINLRTGNGTTPAQVNVATTGAVTVSYASTTFAAGTVFTGSASYAHA